MLEQHYKNWLNRHEADRTGESLRRLLEGHAHGEELFIRKVWWPAIGNLDYLYPEYEVFDFKDGVRYLDFAYLRPPYRISLELDAFGTHARDISRWQFADNLNRQNHIVLDDWKVLRFSYDDVKEKPRQCQQIILQMMGHWFGEERINYPLKQREIIRMATRSTQPLSVKEVCERIGVKEKLARKLLHELVEAEVLAPASGSKRITWYGPGPKLKPEE